MNETLQLTQTRVGDLPLLLGLLIKLGIPGIYDRQIGDHGLHTDLSGGWMLAIWIAFVLTGSDHTKYKVEDWVERHTELLSHLTGQPIRSGDFNDNRLGSLLSRLSKPEHWGHLKRRSGTRASRFIRFCPPVWASCTVRIAIRRRSAATIRCMKTASCSAVTARIIAPTWRS